MEISEIIADLEKIIQKYKKEAGRDSVYVCYNAKVLYKGKEYRVVGGSKNILILEDDENFSINTNETEAYSWEKDSPIPIKVKGYI